MITKSTIEHVANLARLNLTENELEKLTEEMGNIIKYMDKLEELDTSNISPTAHVIPIHNVLRDDVVISSFSRENILQNAPSQSNGCFRVPKVVE